MLWVRHLAHVIGLLGSQFELVFVGIDFKVMHTVMLAYIDTFKLDCVRVVTLPVFIHVTIRCELISDLFEKLL